MACKSALLGAGRSTEPTASQVEALISEGAGMAVLGATDARRVEAAATAGTIVMLEAAPAFDDGGNEVFLGAKPGDQEQQQEVRAVAKFERIESKVSAVLEANRDFVQQLESSTTEYAPQLRCATSALSANGQSNEDKVDANVANLQRIKSNAEINKPRVEEVAFARAELEALGQQHVMERRLVDQELERLEAAAAAADGVDDGEARRLWQQIETVQAEAELRVAQIKINKPRVEEQAEVESEASAKATTLAEGDGGFQSAAKLHATHATVAKTIAPTMDTRDAFARASTSMPMSHGALRLLTHGLVQLGRVDKGDVRLTNSTQASLESWLAELAIGDTFLQEPIDASSLPNKEDKMTNKHRMLNRLFAQTVVQVGWVQQDDPRCQTLSDTLSLRVLDDLAREISIDQAHVLPADIVQIFATEINEPNLEPLEVPSPEPERQHRVGTFDVSVSDWSQPARWVATTPK